MLEILFIQEVCNIQDSPQKPHDLDISAKQSGQEVHEDEQHQVEKEEEPEIQPVGVFREPVRPGLTPLISVLLPLFSSVRASPLADTFGARRRLVHLHLVLAAARRT